MSKRKRVLLGIGAIEVFLAGLWFWLAGMVAQNPDRASPDAQVVIGETMGMVMGALLGLAVPLYVVARRSDLQNGR